MSATSKIEWTDATWNPIRARNLKTGKLGWHCEHSTTGCIHCYAEGMNLRLGTGLPFKPGHRADIEIFLDEAMLTLPLCWKKPRMIFVGSMTDLFADFVTDAMLDRIFAVMALCPQHTFQVLTKRSERMRDYFAQLARDDRACEGIGRWHAGAAPVFGELVSDERWEIALTRDMPLDNVWLGVSCERQEEADARIPHLLATPAAVRFVSAEPLLGPINLSPKDKTVELLSQWYSKDGFDPTGSQPIRDRATWLFPKLDWVICGGESGPKARPMHPDWARYLRDQCAAAGVPFFFKQWGVWAPYTVVPGGDLGGELRAGRVQFVHRDFHTDAELCQRSSYPGDIYMARVGKLAAGRLLDGIEYNTMPGCPW